MNIGSWFETWQRGPLGLRVFSVLALVSVVFLGGYLAVPSVKTMVRESRRQENLTEAREALRNGQYQEARTAALAVLLAGFDDPEAVRMLLDSMDRLRDPRLVEVAMLLLNSKEQPREDRIHAWEVCCREAAMGLVMQASQNFSPEDRDADEFRLPLVDRLIDEGLFADALKVIGVEQDNDHMALNFPWEQRLVRLLVATGKAEPARLAQERVAMRMVQNREEGKQLLPLTDAIPMWQLTTVYHEALMAIAPRTGEMADDRLRRLRAEAGVWLTRRTQILKQMFDDASIDPLIRARWALRCDQPSIAASLVTPEMAAGSVEAFLVRVEGLRRSDQWQACRETLEAAPDGVVEAEVQTELAAVCERLGDRTAVNHAVEEAIIVARLMSETESMVRLAKFAESRGVTAIARRAWVEAAKRRVGPLPLYNRLLPMLQEFEGEQREEDLAEIVMTYRRLEPNNGVVMVHHHYLALLRGVLSPEQAITNLEPIVKENPTFQPARTAFIVAGLLGKMDPAELLRIQQEGKRDWATGANGEKVLLALILAANQRHAEADALFEKVRWDQLLASERNVFLGLRKQFAPASAPVDIERFMPKQRPPEDVAPVDIERFLPKQRAPEDASDIDITPFLPKKIPVEEPKTDPGKKPTPPAQPQR